MLYNGQEEFPAEKLCRLSDAYLAKPAKNSMDLCVRVININPEKESPVLKRSRTLTEYSWFVQSVRENQGKGLPLEEAVQKSIRQCIECGVLKEFLEKNGSEVENMAFGEWDENEARRIAAEEGREEGREEGQKEFIQKLHSKGKSNEEIAALLDLTPEQVQDMLK